jgi:hypothetical protein
MGILVTQREFWERLVDRAILKFDYGASSAETLVSDLVRLGYSQKSAINIIEER